MSRYAQILLHFLHAVANDRDRVHTFLFGTRLTNITRQLKHRDPEIAFEMVAHIVPDWSGGTRIGESLALFNRLWARRVLGQGAVVLLITDGLDRDDAGALSEEAARLARASRAVIWRHQDGAIDARPIVDFADVQSTDYYSATLRFMEI